MLAAGLEILAVILFVTIWIAGLFTWGFLVFYMFKTVTSFHPQRTWGKFLGFSVFMPWFFTEKGNWYRRRMLRAIGLFVILILMGFGIAYVSDTIK